MNKIDELLAHTGNRQYELPKEKWKYFQQWHHTLLLHWQVPVPFLKENIPSGLQLDTFNNAGWVSIAAFEVKDMRLRNFPLLPYISNFQEINLRTYVTRNGIPGIYLFSIETNKLIEVLFSRLFIGLPYEKSKMKQLPYHIAAENKKRNNFLDILIWQKGNVIQKTALDFWLTERHALYEVKNKKIFRFDIHHKEWKLRKIDISITDIRYNFGKYKITVKPDKIQYAEKLDVVLWGRKIVS
ncbi:uncharacterized protein YqjF (DUF2071 family) [Flavobacterium sp. 2755]|uniref:YqjF family protein n=1 Tax=Flavobacterium sp. 2755 TaxID=2817765 RepID=UPI0028629802|nr:DUF2071 domain-containing protein [Flavobacterium sp. 2755]MDR6764415.1 uncharacterized protein YqjF (DUF2071 family) [Flavobacterium sp. 2755]